MHWVVLRYTMRRTLFALFTLYAGVNASPPLIRNANIPACANCKYCIVDTWSPDYLSRYNKCAQFGQKDIITGEITNLFADSCRNDEHLCGYKGRRFEEDRRIWIKIAKHRIVNNWFNISIAVWSILWTLMIRR